MNVNKWLCIGTAVLMSISLMACSSSKSFELKSAKVIVELGNDVSTEAKTYLKENSDKDVIKDTKITFDKNEKYSVDQKKHILVAKDAAYLPVGKYNATATYNKDKEKFTVVVKDTTAPKFVHFKDEITIATTTETVDYTAYFKADDLSKTNISVKSDKVDLTKEGTYEITVKAQDAYKNKVSKKSIVKVVSKEVAAAEGTTQPEANTNQPSVAQPDGTTTNQPTTSGNGSSSTNQSVNQGTSTTPAPTPAPTPTPEKPVLCPGGMYPEQSCDVFIGHPSNVPSDGVYYMTSQDAWNAGMALMDAGKLDGYDVTNAEFNGYTRYIIIYHSDYR